MGESQIKGLATADIMDTHADAAQVLAQGLVHFGGETVFAGRLVLVQCFEDNSKVKVLLNQSGKDANGQGQILVVDGRGSMQCALLGDQIASAAVDNGWSGIVINGCVRDSAILATLPIGVLALGSTPRKSVRRGAGEAHLARMAFFGITVNAGAVGYVDTDGMVILPNFVLQ